MDQNLLAKNFTTILDALKELQSAQQLSDQKIKDFQSLKERMERLERNSERNGGVSKEGTVSESKVENNAGNAFTGDFADIVKRVEKNESNIMENIKDINSYGQKILKSYRVFESYSDIERQELTKSQDMGYVTEQIDVYDSELKQRKLRNNEKKDIEGSF